MAPPEETARSVVQIPDSTGESSFPTGESAQTVRAVSACERCALSPIDSTRPGVHPQVPVGPQVPGERAAGLVDREVARAQFAFAPVLQEGALARHDHPDLQQVAGLTVGQARAKLDGCLLTVAEIEQGTQQWSRLPDPLGPGATA